MTVTLMLPFISHFLTCSLRRHLCLDALFNPRIKQHEKASVNYRGLFVRKMLRDNKAQRNRILSFMQQVYQVES
jgi:hypothetical protein